MAKLFTIISFALSVYSIIIQCGHNSLTFVLLKTIIGGFLAFLIFFMIDNVQEKETLCNEGILLLLLMMPLWAGLLLYMDSSKEIHKFSYDLTFGSSKYANAVSSIPILFVSCFIRMIVRNIKSKEKKFYFPLPFDKS